MTKTMVRFRILLVILAVLLMGNFTLPAGAQVNTTAQAVQEQQLFQQLDRIGGRCSIPDQKACTIEQPAGRDWRHFHEVTLKWIGAISILGMLVLLVVFYLIRDMVRIEMGRSGRTLVRFNTFERFVHWMTATCFIIL